MSSLAAGEDVVENLQDGSGPFAAGEVDDVVQPGGGAERVALDDAVAAGGQPAPWISSAPVRLGKTELRTGKSCCRG